MRRAAVSIPSNLAEGYEHRSDKYLKHHLDIAIGSVAELETQLEIAKDVGYLRDSDFTTMARELDEIIKMLYGLSRRVES